MSDARLTARKPYLLRAFYDWLIDNQLTPHLIVDVNVVGINVPMEYARDGQIVLNISPQAVEKLRLTNTEVSLNASFGGIPRKVFVPMAAVTAIYARENGAGTLFEPEPAYESPVNSVDEVTRDQSSMSVIEGEGIGTVENSDNTSAGDSSHSVARRPTLRVIK